MSRTLKILHLEDVDSDAEMVNNEFKRANIIFDQLVVDIKQDYVKAISEYKPDVVLSDHSLPAFNSLEALNILKESGLKVPFILVTGNESEEFMVNIMKAGASDYIFKNRIQHLPNAVLNSIEKFQSEAETECEYNELSLLFNTVDEVFFSMDMISSKLIQISSPCEDMFGYRSSELLINPGLWSQIIYPEDRYIWEESYERLKNGEAVVCQHWIIRKDHQMRWLESKIIPKLSEEGILFKIHGVTRDVTESKNAEEEREKITAELIKRNQDLEQFTYIISHNLRSHVANIKGLSNLLNCFEYEDKECIGTLETLSRSVNSLDKVIIDLNQILQTGKQVNDKNEWVSLPVIFEEIVSEQQPFIVSNNALVSCDFSEISELFILKSYLYSVFQNLIVNSIKYRKVETDPIINITSKLNGDKVSIYFTDNGKGIDLAKHGAQLFGLYKRFDHSIEGKGMGLFMVKMQVESIGGAISVKSELDKGTEFKIELFVGKELKERLDLDKEVVRN